MDKFKATNSSKKFYDNRDIKGHLKRDSIIPAHIVSEEKAKVVTRVTTSEFLKKSNPMVVDFFKKELLTEIIEKSIYIGEFYAIHKGNQELYENRKVQKEIHFITNDYNNTLNVVGGSERLYYFPSSIFDKLFVVDVNCCFSVNNLAEPNKGVINFSLFNILEKSHLVLDVFNNEDPLTYTNEFYLLLNNIELIMFDYLKYSRCDSTLSHYEKLNLSKKTFNFKSYLPVIHNHTYTDKAFLAKGHKFIQKGNSSLLVFNFTPISDRIILFNKDTFSIVHNIYINPMEFYKLINITFHNSLSYLLRTLINKRWSLEDIQNFNKVIERMRKEKKSLYNIKLLISILNNENSEKIKAEVSNHYHIAGDRRERYTHNELLYQAIVNLIVYTFDCDFDFFIFMYDFQKFLNRIANLSLITETGCIEYFSNIDQLITDKKIFDTAGNLIPDRGNNKPIDIKYLVLIKIVSRNFNFKKIIHKYDKDGLYHITRNEFLRILKSLPMGITDEEAEGFVDLMPKDEFGHILYEIFFQSEDYMICDLILKNKGNKFGKKKAYGYLTKNKNTDLDDFYKCISLTYKANDIIDYADINEYLQTKVEKDGKIKRSYLSLFNVNTTVQNLAFVSNLNIFFMITDEKLTSKIAILKYKHVQDHKSRVITEAKLLGYIDTMSTVNPRLLTFLPERNVLVTQSIQKNSVDILLYDVYKDIVDIFQVNSLWRVTQGTVIKSVIDKPIDQFNYLPGNKLFFIKSGNDVKIINPKSKQHDLAIKYYHDRQAESVYDKVCKTICERPSELTGDTVFKVVKHLKLGNGSSNVVTLSYPLLNQQALYVTHYQLDYLLIIENNTSLKSIGITSLFCSIKAVGLDNIIPEFEQLNVLAQKQKKKILTSVKDNLKKAITAMETKVKENQVLLDKVRTYSKDIIVHGKPIPEKDIKETISKLTGYTDVMNLFGKLNILYDNSHYGKLSIKDRFNQVFKTTYKINEKEQYVLELLKRSGFDIISFFRRVKNCRIEFSAIDKTTFLNMINTKMSLLIKDFKPEDLQIFGDIVQNSVTFDGIYKILSATTHKSRDIKYNVKVSKSILENLNLLPDKAYIHREQDKQTDETPLNSGIKKFSIIMVMNKIPLDNSFKVFDEFDDEIIDIKQFTQAFKKFNNINIQKIEIEAIFRAIDCNNSDCITLKEYDTFVQKDIRHVYNGYLSQIPADFVITTKQLDALLDPPSLPKFNDEYLYLTFMKFFDFLETSGIRLDLSFKLFDINNHGFIFLEQFVKTASLGGKLNEKEILTIFHYIDIHRKGYIYENDFYAVMQHYLLNPGPNRKKYLRMIREEGLVNKRDPLGHLKSKIDTYTLTDGDVTNISFFVIKRLNEFVLSSDLKECAKKEKGLFLKLSNNEEFMRNSDFKAILKNLVSGFKTSEIDIFCERYIDARKFGLVFYHDFYEKIESVMKYINLIETKNISVPEEDKVLHTFRPLQKSLSINPNSKSSNTVEDEQKDSRYIYHTLKIVQDILRTTGLKVDQIFYVLDSGKHGFLTLSALMRNLPLKFHINLNINQHLAFFNYLDKSKNGYILFEQFKNFFDVNFASMIFENEEFECYTLLDKVQERILQLLNKEHADIRNIYDSIIQFDQINNGLATNWTIERGFLDCDDIVSFFKNLLGLRISIHDMKLIFDLFFGDKKVYAIGLRKFLILLELLGVNTNLYTDIGDINELVDENIIFLLNSFTNKYLNPLKDVNTNDLPISLIYKCLDEYDTNKDSLLDAKEFTNFLKTMGITNSILICNLILRFSDQENNNLIPLTNFALTLKYLFKLYAGKSKTITNMQRLESNTVAGFLNNSLPGLAGLIKISTEIATAAKDYQDMIHQGIFSGLIIFSKFFENNNFTNILCLTRRALYDYFTIFSKKANNLITSNFKLRIHKVEKTPIKLDYTKLDIPNVQIHILNKNNCENVEEIYYKSEHLGEHFNIYHDGLQKYVRVTRFIKSAVRGLISKDNQSFLGHIEYSLKLNHYLQQNPENKKCNKSYNPF
jgi:Ca2+-binding EF-hand superfamily protein